ncbi:hypothetical protein AM571_CH00292 [Rhizobium etli 8C-3]|uniref:Uncharacterized protein n=2 Tax=Rhizobium TaxID=379 RepID=A0A4R3QXA7_9HYPH|nr:MULTISPECIES: hypothetical protein [Rhizobium]APO73145.1 hypothetical protein AM571_CH00292 [Rhizobium etli 8C-3]TCU26751.1 hypothetical protein EV130_104363 [Rhizobium azibense]TCU38681.1 hypothetical protein EV129_104285 [Rhizobium azibense]
MAGFKLDARARLSIELALTAGRGDPIFARQQEMDAKALGITGAEVDMARKGSSFDFQLSKAIALALKPDAEHRERTMKAGIDAQACADIEELAASYISRSRLRSP